MDTSSLDTNYGMGSTSEGPPKEKKGGNFARDALKLVGGTTLAQIITILTAPILSRLFAPDAFGVLAVFTSLVSLIGVVICLRYEFAIMLPERDEEAANVFALSILIAGLLSGLVAVVIYYAYETILKVLRVPDLAPYLWLLPVALLIHGVFQALNYWNSRLRHFGSLSISRVAASLTTSFMPMVLSTLGRSDAGGLIWSWMTGSTVFTLTLAGQVWRTSKEIFRKSLHIERMLVSLKRYRKFPLVDSWSGFINSTSWQLPSLFLAFFFSDTVVGYFSMASRIILLPMSLIGNAIAQVFFQRTTSQRQEPHQMAHTAEAVFRILVAISWLPSFALTILGKDLFIVIFGETWAEAGIYVEILGMWMFFLFISSPMSTLVLTRERQEQGLVMNTLIFGSRLVSLVIGGLFGNPFLAMALWSFTGIIVYGGWAILNLTLAGVSLRSGLSDFLRYFIFSLPWMAILVLTRWFIKNPSWLIPIICGIVILANYLVILRKDRALFRPIFSALSIFPNNNSHEG